jgi:hypothetical protein
MYMEQVHKQIQPGEASREAVKEKLPHVKTQYSKTVYPKEHANIVQPMTAQHLTNSTANYHLPLTEKKGTWEYDKRPYIWVLLQ